MRRLVSEHQGMIDGMCGVYSVVNGLKALYNHSESQDAHVFKAVCFGVRTAFPEVIVNGCNFTTLKKFLEAAQKWCNVEHKHEPMIFSTPYETYHFGPDTIDFFDNISEQISGRDVAIIGIEAPWSHWTVMQKTRGEHAYFFDSSGFPSSVVFNKFVFWPKTEKGLISLSPRDTVILSVRE
jgi:hypothetical protein